MDQTAAGYEDVINGILVKFAGLSSKVIKIWYKGLFKNLLINIKKVRAMVTDNVDVMEYTAGRMNLGWHGCIPHPLNLIVK